jgi:UDP-3-O-[3-hydroxymyristoyl] glucosamine N-acyltransferase
VDLTMTAAEIARFLNGRLVGDGAVVVKGLAKIEEATPHDLSFVANVKYVRYLEETQAAVVLVSRGSKPTSRTTIEVEDPYVDFLRLLELFHPKASWLKPGVDPSAVVDPTAVIGEDVTVGAHSYIGPRVRLGNQTAVYPLAVLAADVSIGEHCEIHSHVSIREGARLGNRVVIHDGAVIGSDGFGFAPTETGYRKVPQLGIVVIEDDVEIGANTTIDRATLGDTLIGKGTKLDNLIQVAHNVTIGSNTVIAAQTGISGSAKIGNDCRLGGQVGLAGHLRVADRAQIAAQSGVGGDVPAGETVSGSPSRPHALWKRIEASLTRLPDLFKRVRALESAVFGTKSREKADV